MGNAPEMATAPPPPHHSGSLTTAARRIGATRGRARQFWGVFDRCLVPMVTVDNERRCVAANRAARLLFRLSQAEMRERRIDDFAPSHMALLLEDACARLLRDGSVAGAFDVSFLDGSHLRIVYCASANTLPGQHLIVFAPANWPEDELGAVDEDGTEPSPAPVSPREREVLTLIAAGADLDQIAHELSISVNTVRTHIINAYRKLGAHNRAHAIALAMQQGLIDLPRLRPRCR